MTTRIGDDVIAELGLDQVAAIKIDVEGAELSVMRGLSKTFARDKPTLLFEVLPNFYGEDRVRLAPDLCAKNQETAQALYALLSDAGYVVNRIHGDGSMRPIKRFDLDDTKDYVGFNYLAEAA